MIRFAFSGILHVYQDEVSGGKMMYEVMEKTYINNRYGYDIDCDIDIILDKIDLPNEEGMYHLWFTGNITHTQDYWGEWDVSYNKLNPIWSQIDAPVELSELF